jgi:hypothetical protein
VDGVDEPAQYRADGAAIPSAFVHSSTPVKVMNSGRLALLRI